MLLYSCIERGDYSKLIFELSLNCVISPLVVLQCLFKELSSSQLVKIHNDLIYTKNQGGAFRAIDPTRASIECATSLFTFRSDEKYLCQHRSRYTQLKDVLIKRNKRSEFS